MAFGSSTTTISGAFADFFLSTTKRTYSSADKFILEFAARSYFIKRLQKGKPATTSFQNGSAIQDYLIFDEGGSGQRYDPNGELSPGNPQGMVLTEIPWAFTSYDLTWTKHELALQAGGRDSNGQFAVFKKVAAAKRAMLKGRFANSTERDLWAQPDTTKMESKTGPDPQEPMCIPAMINGFANGLFPAYSPGGVWTTKQGIAPATRTAWNCNVQTYLDDVDALAVGEDYDLFAAFDRAQIATEYEGMPFGEEIAPESTSPQIYVTDEGGKADISKALRKANNHTRTGPKDASYSGPVFDNREIVSIQALNSADLYPNLAGTALVDVSDSTVVGVSGGTATRASRFYLLHTGFMAMVWHSDYYFDPSEKTSPYRQPHVTTIWYDTWGNLFFRSLRHHAFIHPGGPLV